MTDIEYSSLNDTIEPIKKDKRMEDILGGLGSHIGEWVRIGMHSEIPFESCMQGTLISITDKWIELSLKEPWLDDDPDTFVYFNSDKVSYIAVCEGDQEDEED